MSETCSPVHAQRLKHLHANDPTFGVIGHLWAENVAAWMQETGSRTLLDYGCGRSNLAASVAKRLVNKRYDILFAEYDPATKPGQPKPAEYITCIDVMEHVEADRVDAVLDEIRKLMGKAGLITISLRWASPKKRKTHPNVWTREKWLEKLHQYFHVEEIMPLDPTKAKSEIAAKVEPIP